jgi:hypothetical protein
LCCGGCCGGRGDLEAEEGEHAAGDAQDVGGDLVGQDALVEGVGLLLEIVQVHPQPQARVVLPAQLPEAHLRVEVLQVVLRHLAKPGID